jgi:replicative DNA helicase
MNILSNIASTGICCGLFALDSTKQEIINKYKSLSLNCMNFFVDSRYSVEQISAICKSFNANDKKMNVIAIDYIQLLDRDIDDINAFYDHIKAVARELNICIIVLSQVRRSIRKQAAITDLKEFYPFAVKADMTILLNRPDTLATKEEVAKFSVEKGDITLTVYKNCDKPLGEASLLFNSDSLRFYDLDK